VDEGVLFDFTTALVGNAAFVAPSREVYVWQPGYYFVNAGLHHKEPCQFAVMKNDIVVVPGGIFSSPTGSTQATTSLIMYVDVSDLISPTPLSPSGFACKVQLKNHTSYVPVVSLDGTSGAGSAEPDINCYLSLILLKG
jgi:hypothetical protein